MFRQAIPGFHTSLTDEVVEIVVGNVKRGLTVGQIARLSKLAKSSLRNWLKHGEQDLENGNSTIFSQLWLRVEEIRGNEIADMLDDVRARKKNWQAPWEILRVIAREDFGCEAYEYKELLELYLKLREDFKRLKDSHGGSRGKLDSVGNQEDV